MRLIVGIIILSLVLSACNIDTGGGTGISPTQETGAIEPTTPVEVVTSDGCAVASASGLSAEELRASAPRTLPNGNAFPGKAPRGVGAGGGGGGRPDGRIEVMIRFTPESSPNERNEYIRTIGGTSRRQIDALNTYVVILGPNTRPDRLPESPIVLGSEINETASATQASAPNDPRYAEQWSMPVVGLPQAWETLPGGTTVTVAVIDSGVCLDHPDLQGRITAGYDFVDDDSSPQDTFGHGCGVAGVIAANSNNGVGIAGIAPNVRIMPLRVLDSSGLGNYANISAAIIYAADNGANIINMSLAGPTYSQIMADAIAYAISRGVIVIAAAGNQGREGAYYPAAFPSVVGVGSIDPDLNHSSFSNYGANVDVWAPGRDILTTNLIGDYEFMSGTSFAAPVVSGLTALAETFNTPLNVESGIIFLYPPTINPDC